MFKAIAEKLKPFQGLTKNNNSLKNKLIKGAAGSVGLRIAASGLAFIMSIIFARFLGKAGLGTYSFATTWANLLSIPAVLGIDQLLVREVAIYRTKSQWSLLGGILRWANLIVLASSVICSIVAVAVAFFWNSKSGSDSTVVIAIAIAMITIPFASLRSLRLGAMKGLLKVVLGQIPDSLFAPLIVISLSISTYFLFPGNFNVFWVLIIKIFAVIITFLIGALWLWRSLPSEVHQVKPQYKGKKWLIDSLPFMFMGTAQLINSRIDILMLGAIKGVEVVGIYVVIVGITRLTNILHQAANNVLSPTIATLYSEGKVKQLEKIVRQSVLIVFVISLLIGLTIVGLGKYLLMIFGSEFLPGHTAMIILVLGQVFHALTGPVGILLNMTGYQNYTAFTVGLTAILNIILNAIFIPLWGINGAAIATTSSLIVINILKVIFMQKKLGISIYYSGSKNNKI